MLAEDTPKSPAVVTAESLLTVLGVVYTHRKTSDGGDLYLTRYGLPFADHLELDNWYEKQWFESNRQRLEGTSAVYRVPTKTVNGVSMDLVVKNSRVGEHVPLETKTLMEFVNTEFNSPWEEFALTFELREGKYGEPGLTIDTQLPLAIYVPPETMQIWQSGRSQSRINRICVRHPGIDLDILRQYKLIYGWIHGKDLIELVGGMGMSDDTLNSELVPLTKKVIADLDKKGYVMVDMKPSHIIIAEEDAQRIESIACSTEEDGRRHKLDVLRDCIGRNRYAVVDYELLIRTPAHEEEVFRQRRHSYLDAQRDRLIATGVPSYLSSTDVLGVPYICGHVESTGGQLWVVGRNAQLFDYFLPERWRKTHAWRLSENSEVYYTVTKDHIHLVWKTSRVGEFPGEDPADPFSKEIREYGFNSPFEECAIARALSENGIPTVYMRAIYMTGSGKVEQSTDQRRYESHRVLLGPDNGPILREDHNYITVRGYFNGPDEWVAKQTGKLCRPVNLAQALGKKLIDAPMYDKLIFTVERDLKNAGYDGKFLKGNDLLLALDPDEKLLVNKQGLPEVRICNFELIRKV
jgi:hypothetical protein